VSSEWLRRIVPQPRRVDFADAGEREYRTEGVIDEVIVKVHPVLIGGGIPLFGGALPKLELELAGTRAFSTGVLVLRYVVKNRGATSTEAPENPARR
jgi:hypothetical protein